MFNLLLQLHGATESFGVLERVALGLGPCLLGLRLATPAPERCVMVGEFPIVQLVLDEVLPLLGQPAVELQHALGSQPSFSPEVGAIGGQERFDRRQRIADRSQLLLDAFEVVETRCDVVECRRRHRRQPTGEHGGQLVDVELAGELRTPQCPDEPVQLSQLVWFDTEKVACHHLSVLLGPVVDCLGAQLFDEAASRERGVVRSEVQVDADPSIGEEEPRPSVAVGACPRAAPDGEVLVAVGAGACELQPHVAEALLVAEPRAGVVAHDAEQQ